MAEEPYPRLSGIGTPADLRQLPEEELPTVAAELRDYLLQTRSASTRSWWPTTNWTFHPAISASRWAAATAATMACAISSPRWAGNNFLRLRIGIGHPGHSSQVTGFVLGKAPSSEQSLIDEAIDRALKVMPLAVSGEVQKAMNELHSSK